MDPLVAHRLRIPLALTDATVPFAAMRLLASEVAAATGGSLVGPDVEVDGAAFDSRELMPGQLFVPLVAERDGHDFIPAAVAAGAPAYLSRRLACTELGASAILVSDTAAALMDLAAWARQRLTERRDMPVVAVTGSVGKTSTKDLIAAALGATRRTTANVRSFNNEQGLPVTILGAPDDTEALVLEMGMRGFGEIARLCTVAAPTIGVVTAVAGAHTGRVGSIDGVALAKRELVEALPPGGTAVLNADDARVAAMAAHSPAEVVTYGLAGDVRITGLTLDRLARPAFRVVSPWGGGDVRLAVSGRHMAFNAAAALAVAGVVEGSIEAAIDGLGRAALSARRMEVARSAGGAVIVNDAYNANPDSMRAALDAIAAIEAGRRIAVLGPMAELDDPPAGHARVAADAAERGVVIVPIGTELYGTAPAAASAAEFDPAVLGELGEGDVVLVKASNGARLWTVAERLLAG
jgi:UDP-N-acetylmuramoyl-tripeptide--D-alanyl-D-alanine ligase